MLVGWGALAALAGCGGEPGEGVSAWIGAPTPDAVAVERPAAVALAVPPPAADARGELAPAGPAGAAAAVPPPAEDVRSGAIAGDVLLDPEVPGELLSLVAVSSSGAWRSAPVGSDGAFELGGLAPGEVSVRVRGGVDAEPLARVDGVRVEPGATARDPRLAGLDLRERLRLLELRATDAEGAPVGGATALVRAAGAGGRPLRRPLAAGGSRWLLPWPAADVEVRAPGFLPERRDAVQGSLALELRRAPAVRLALADTGALPPHPLRLRADLRPLGGGPPAAPAPATFDAHGEARLAAPALGLHEVRYWLERPGDPLPLGFAGAARATIEVRDEPGEQLFEVSPGRAAVGAAARDLLGREP